MISKLLVGLMATVFVAFVIVQTIKKFKILIIEFKFQFRISKRRVD